MIFNCPNCDREAVSEISLSLILNPDKKCKRCNHSIKFNLISLCLLYMWIVFCFTSIALLLGILFKYSFNIILATSFSSAVKIILFLLISITLILVAMQITKFVKSMFRLRLFVSDKKNKKEDK